MSKANDAISAEACWTCEFGEWRTFAVSSDALKLARQAAAWSKIADEGDERAATADETGTQTTAKHMPEPGTEEWKIERVRTSVRLRKLKEQDREVAAATKATRADTANEGELNAPP
jgi:hypothetical protein